jgi:uncharacterized OB-fold protein
MEREVLAYKCRNCGTLHYPFRMVCKNCRANKYFEFDPVPLPRKGKLVTFTFIHNLPAEFEVPKLGLGIVELENGVKVTGQVDIADPKLGMEVRGDVEVIKKEPYVNRYGFVFRAA